MLQYRSKHVQQEANCIHLENKLERAEMGWVAVGHNKEKQDQEQHELADFNKFPCSWDNESILIEKWCPAWIIERYRFMFVMIWQYVYE